MSTLPLVWVRHMTLSYYRSRRMTKPEEGALRFMAQRGSVDLRDGKRLATPETPRGLAGIIRAQLEKMACDASGTQRVVVFDGDQVAITTWGRELATKLAPLPRDVHAEADAFRIVREAAWARGCTETEPSKVAEWAAGRIERSTW